MTLSFATLLTAASLAAGLGPPAPLALPGRQSAVAWAWPLAGTPVVARSFAPPTTPWGAGHRGVDLAAPPGATVLAAGPGVVSFAGYVAGVGVVSIVHAGGLRTTYEPVAPRVAAGAAMSLGEPIGTLQSGHGDCGPGRWCLHWGLLRGAGYLDPLTLIRRGPVRLLPLSGDTALTSLPRDEPPPLPLGLAAAAAPVGRAAEAEQARTRAVAGGTPEPGPTSPAGARSPAADRASSAADRIGRLATGATGTATAAALVWSIRAARQRRMAAHRGRHRGRGLGQARVSPAAGISRAGRRAWP